jgi:hypothetical protein
MQLKVPSDKFQCCIRRIWAEILSDHNRQEGSKLLESLDDETLADRWKGGTRFPGKPVEQLPNERIADVLEECRQMKPQTFWPNYRKTVPNNF